MDDAVVLRRKGYDKVSGGRGDAVIGLFMLIAVASFLLPIFVSSAELEGFDSTTSRGGQVAHLLRLFAPIFITTVAAVFVVVRGIRDARLEITSEGIRHFGGVRPAILFGGNWTLRWDEVASITLGKAFFDKALVPLRIRGAKTTRILYPAQWTDPSEAGKPRGEYSREPALVRILIARGVLKPETNASDPASDINSNAAAQAAAMGFIGLVLYFIFEVYFGLKEFYAEGPPYGWLLGMGLFGMAMAMGGLRLGRAGSRDSALIALLFGGSVGLAGYPFLLRVNAWTDSGGLQPHAYVLQADGMHWRPAEEGLPVLTFDVRSGYWEQFQPGHGKKFELRRGGLGFYQVSLEAIYAEQKIYYRSHADGG